ncbi:MAG TPA: 6,7-dimethyl-8-ribityllumazine synthase [Candidatus Babeliales bacterium]|nr:6,7-dimethyl-8-ribityllumazine synthase [Candidatus Babeliales bacterium]
MKHDGAREAAADCRGRRFAIVAARFYAGIADRLIDGAKRALRDCKVSDDDVEVFEVPGCFELPLACRKLADMNRFDALVAVGAVVRGETPHFDFIAGECVRGIMDVQLATGVPIGLGVLTTDDLEQALARADRDRGDKGYAAALAAASLLRLAPAVPAAATRRN